jgi:hypothetical protein
MWKKAAVAYFKVLSRYLPGGTEKTTKNLGQHSWSPGRDLNPGSPEHEAGPKLRFDSDNDASSDSIFKRLDSNHYNRCKSSNAFIFCLFLTPAAAEICTAGKTLT